MATEKFLNQDGVSQLWEKTKEKIAAAPLATKEYITNFVQTALANYATDTAVQDAITRALLDYMTTDEIDAAIAKAIADAASIRFESVASLPGTGEVNVIYLVPNSGAGGNIKDEFMWIDGAWEKMGSTDIDLSGYWDKTDLQAMTADELTAILV